MMRAVAYNEDFADRIRETLAGRTDVQEKKMFGGLTFMVGGQMCCGVLKNDLVVRAEPGEFYALIAQPHVRPFDFSGRPMQNMVYVNVDALNDAGVLQTWVRRGTDYVAAHRPTAKPTQTRVAAPGSPSDGPRCVRARPCPGAPLSAPTSS
jgi:TfoX/Sxy family transcriptional regulator of competence genes